MRKIPEWSERLFWQSLISPVIIKVKDNKFKEAIEWVNTNILIESVIEKLIKKFITPERIKQIEEMIMNIKIFNYVALPLPREFIWALEGENFVEKIYYDYDVKPLTLPTVPEDGVYDFIIAKKFKVKGTSTYWTKIILGCYNAHSKGFYGYGVTVAVLDTGAFKLPGLEKVKLRKVVGMTDVDIVNGHGCVTPETRIFMANCGIIKIEDLYNSINEKEEVTNAGISKKVNKDLYVYTFSENGELVKDKVLYVHKLYYNGEVYRVKIRGRQEIVLTPWHPVMTLENGRIKYKRADQLNVGDLIAVNGKVIDYNDYQKVIVDGQEIVIDEDIAYVLGFFTGDGTVQYSKGKAKEVRMFDEKIETLIYEKVKVGKNKVIRTRRKVPEVIFKSPASVRAAYLAGLIDAEARVIERNTYRGKDKNFAYSIRIVNTSYKLMKDVSVLLASLGIPARVYKSSSKSYEEKGWSPLYEVRVSGFWKILKLYNLCKDYLVSHKKKVLEELIVDYYNRHEKQYHIEHDKKLYNASLLFLEVVKIEKEKYEGWMYDLTTEKYNTYLADGVVAHNTWVSSCIVSRHVIDERYYKLTGEKIPVEGMSPGVNCYSIKCLEFYGGKTSWVIKAIEDAVFKYNVDVLNMSLGGPLHADKPEDDPMYHPLKVCKDLDKIACVASGNEGKGNLSSPGSLPVVLRVGAYDPVKGKIAKFTSRGITPWGEIVPDIVMPGVWIYAHATGECDIIDSHITGFSALSGTSMSTPCATGLISLMKEAHRKLLGKELTLDEVILMMTELGEYPEKDEDYGYGVLTWNKYENWLSTQYGVEV